MNLTNADIKNLKDKKYKHENNLFVVEGIKFCRDLLNTDVEILFTITTNKDLKDFPNICVVSNKMLSSLASTKTCQDIICVCKVNQYKIKSLGNSLILDNLQDPGNVGTLIRSAVAFNFNDIYFIEGVDPYNEKVIRSSAGTILKSRLHFVDLKTLKAHKKEIADVFLVADMFGENVNNFKPQNRKYAVIVGNEGQGISDEMLKISDEKIAIPMSKTVESLNAGVAGSIIMQKLGEIK